MSKDETAHVIQWLMAALKRKRDELDKEEAFIRELAEERNINVVD